MLKPHLSTGLKVFNTYNGTKLAILTFSTSRDTLHKSKKASVLRKHRNLLKRGIFIDEDYIR